MNTFSQPAVFVPAAITRVVDERCNSLANPGTASHPGLMLFGQGPSNRKMFILDHGELVRTTVVGSGGAWSGTCDASKGVHSFSVCTSEGDISPSWEITIELPTVVEQPASVTAEERNGYWSQW